MPDAYVFALAATALVTVAAFVVDPAVRDAPGRLVDGWGDGFWSLIPFTLQMAMIIVGGYMLASAPPIFRVITWMAGKPQSAKGAVLLVALVAMSSSLLNWGFSLIVSAILAREVARRVPAADYRALGASAFLGLGTVWAQGLSGSAALQMARASSMPARLAEIVGGPIPLTETIFRWQSLVAVGYRDAGGLRGGVAVRAGRRARTLRRGSRHQPRIPDVAGRAPAIRPGRTARAEPMADGPVYRTRCALSTRSIVMKSATASDMLNALDLNTVNLLLLTTGAALHRTPASMIRAVKEATPATWGVLLQFPLYGGIFGIMTGTTLSAAIAGLFVHVATATALSGHDRQLFGAAGRLRAVGRIQVGDRSAVRAAVGAGAWRAGRLDGGDLRSRRSDRQSGCSRSGCCPTLALLGLKARDIMGYTYLVALVVFPLVLLLVTAARPAREKSRESFT